MKYLLHFKIQKTKEPKNQGKIYSTMFDRSIVLQGGPKIMVAGSNNKHKIRK